MTFKERLAAEHPESLGDSFYEDYTGQVRLFMNKTNALEYMREHFLDFAFHDSCAIKKASVNIELKGE